MIRRAGPADAAALATLNSHVQALHVAWAPHRYLTSDPTAVVVFFDALLAREDVIVALAESDGLDGYAVGSVQTREVSAFKHASVTMVLDQIGVRSDRRGAGVGRALMGWMEAEGRARGCEQMQLEVLAVNEGARGFYERLGYLPEQVRYGKVILRDSG
ncbi:MAG: GNAT family N-acetyltransferase [Myxococcota bacterium]